MKSLNNIVIATLILSTSLLIVPTPVHASMCTYSEKYHALPQIFTLSSYVFTGTVITINNDTDHHWEVNFSVEKLWKGMPAQSITVITDDLQGCGYSITPGGKYLVYAISSPPFLQISWTKAYADAQPDIVLLNDPNFQAQEKTKEDLNEKLEAAKKIIENMMESHTSDIPFNLVGVDVLNSSLHIGIDSTKATLPIEKYEKKIKDFIGDIPITIEFTQLVAGMGGDNPIKTVSPLSSKISPLKQFHSGIPIKNIACLQDLQLVIKAEDGSPACVKPQTAQKLVERGWGTIVTSPIPNPTPTSPSPLSNATTYTVGQKVGVFTISKINPYNVTGYYNSPYPLSRPGLGDFTIMHVGDILNPTCDGAAPLVITGINYPNSITVSIGKSMGRAYHGCPICLSANSEIKTPNGDVNVKDIKDGLTVWSTDLNGIIIKSKVIKISHVFVGDTHKVIDLELSDGRELFVSPNHPTYDERIIADLKVGETYDGSTIKSIELIPYKYQFTYDILPDSQTGNYFANGVLVGSTLK